MIFTAAIAILAAVGSVPAYVSASTEALPTVSKGRPGCYIVSLQSKVGPISGEICGPQEPLVYSEAPGCFTFTSGTEETVLCRDGNASSSTSPIAKRYIRPQVRKAYGDCYNVSLNSKKGRIETQLCGPHAPQIRSLPKDCFAATIGRTEVSLCIDGSLASSTSEL